MNRLAPFNTKQVSYIKRSRSSWLNVLEGGKRGGKNIVNTLAWCIAVDSHEDELHLAAGVSVANAKLNIIDSNGLGVLHYFAGRCKQGKYQDRDCVYVDTAKGRKIILVSGGGKKGDEKLIQGNSYGTVLITEANNCHIDFVRETFDRTMSSSDRKIFHDFNPKPPKHWYYMDVVAFHEKQQRLDDKYGYNYAHFTIADNLSLTVEEKEKILATYDKDSIWYKRDIEGKRIVAEGSIYPLFANNIERYLIDPVPSGTPSGTVSSDTSHDVMIAAIGVDFGGSKSGQAFSCVGFTRGFKEVIILDEEYRTGTLDNPNTLATAFVEFCKRNKSKYPVVYAFADSAEQILIRGLESKLMRERIGIQMNNSLKIPIIDRIRLENMLFATDRIKIMRHCKTTQEGFSNAVWDDKSDEDERLDNFTSNIDILDAVEYAIEAFASQINFGAKLQVAESLREPLH